MNLKYEPEARSILVKSYEESSLVFACFRIILKKRLGRDDFSKEMRTIKKFIHKEE